MLKNNEISLQNKILIGALMLFIAVYFLVERMRPAPPEIKSAEPVYADTVIPRGYVLVPVEIGNIQAVSGLIDKFGIIDLYAGSTSQHNSFLIAAKIKMMRAPLNPSQYAVLVSESMSREIMKYRGPFWAVVQSRGTEASALHIKKPQPLPFRQQRPAATPVQIDYYKGSI